MSEAVCREGLSPGFYVAKLGEEDEFYFKVNEIRGVPYIWGFSVYKGEPGYRTLGIRLDDWRGSYPDTLVLPDHDRTQVVSDLAGLAAHAARPGNVGQYDTSSPFEPIKIIEHYNLNFALGNVVKYVLRAGKKPGASDIEDLEKARQYIDFEIARRKKEV